MANLFKEGKCFITKCSRCLYCHGNEHMSGLYFTVQPHFPVLSPVSDQTSACNSKCGVGRCKDVATGDIPCKCTAGLPWGDRHPIHPFAIRPTNAWWFQYRWHINRGKGPFDKVIEVSMPWVATSTSPTVKTVGIPDESTKSPHRTH